MDSKTCPVCLNTFKPKASRQRTCSVRCKGKLGNIIRWEKAATRAAEAPPRTEKKCACCEQTKPLSEYGVDRSKKDGLNKYCKPCIHEFQKATYYSRTGRDPDSIRRWHYNHPNQRRESDGHIRPIYGSEMEARRARRDKALRRLYGITLETFEALVEHQQGRCKICEKATKLVVDHAHDGTGRVRGLLCIACNAALGRMVGDSPEGVDRLKDYLASDIRAIKLLTNQA